ncbi:ricin-type beta-trefoil lectin domain protein [Streptomyces sp. NPDC055815]
MAALATPLPLAAAAEAATPTPSPAPSARIATAERQAAHAGGRRGAVLDALARAKKTRRDVPLPQLTDEYTTTVATPAGRLRSDRSLQVQRVKRADGSWAALDDTLTRRADGTLGPAVASASLAISGGGTGPLATMTASDGSSLAVYSPFPAPLPKPELEGSGALYRNIAPDTDLKVTVTKWGGYSTVLVLNTPAAAANPKVRELVFPARAKGLTLGKDEHGNLSARRGDSTVFSAPPPRMWSAGPARTPAARAMAKLAAADGRTAPDLRPSTAEEPGTTATVADIPVASAAVTPAGSHSSGPSVSTGSIVMKPSPELLDASATSYPVYVDPSWSPDARGKQHHAWVMSAWTGTGNFDRTGSSDRDRPGMGYQGWESPYGIERALYEFDIHGYTGAHINRATLRVNQYISSDWSCTTKYPVTLYRAREFDSSVSWNNHEVREWLGSKDVPGNGHSQSCYGDIGIDFDITGAMRDAIRDVSKPIAFVLRGREGSGDKIAFKRFSYDATLSTEYDFPPDTPQNPRATPTPRRVTAGDTNACGAVPSSEYGWVTSTNTTLTSWVKSPNQGQLTEWVNVWDESAGNATAHTNWSGFVSSGSDASYTLPYGTLQDGHRYGWVTHGDDGLLRGPASTTCHFGVDLTPPTLAFGDFTDPATQFPPSGSGRTTQLHVNQQGSIPVSASDPGSGSGLACIEYGYDPQLAGATRTCAKGLTVGEIKTTPTKWGTNILYARVLDEAGNSSQTMSYSFYVPWAPGPVAFGDTNGDARPDMLVPDTSGNLITFGRAMAPGDATPPPFGTAAPVAQSPEVSADRTWKDYRVSHRGSMDPGRNVDDLFAHREPTVIGGTGGDQLFVYSNTLSDPGRFTLGTQRAQSRPNCSTALTDCTGYHNNVGWKYTSQLTPIGAVTDTRTPSGQVTSATGLLAVESGHLWYYPPKSAVALRPPVKVDTGDWDNKDLMVPGATRTIGKDVASAPSLWVRDRQSGEIRQYTLTTAVLEDTLGEYPVVTGVAANPTAPIGVGFSLGTFPRVGSEGDVTGDGIPDIWAVDQQNVLSAYAGVATDGVLTGFDENTVRGSTKAPYAHWPLTADAKGFPAAFGGTAANVTYTDDTVDGHPAKVAVFNGTDSTVTTAGPVVDTRKSFTITTWAKMAAPDGVIVSQDTVHGSAFMLWADSGHWRFALAADDTDGWPYHYNTTVTPANAFKADTWTHLAASYDATTGMMNLYVNGVLASSGHHPANTSPAPSGSLVMGRYKYQSGPRNFLNGRIGGLAVHDSAVAPTPTGPIRFAASPDVCLDLPNGEPSRGLQTWGCNGTPAQQFAIKGDGSIQAASWCVDAVQEGTANGTQISMWYCNNGGNQRWLPRADGSIYNPASGRCLDMPWGDVAWTRRPALFDCNGTSAQRWSVPGLLTPALPAMP